MTDEQKAAYIIAQSACASIRAQGMAAGNYQRMHRGENLAYTEADFEKLINEFGIHHNACIGLFHDL